MLKNSENNGTEKIDLVTPTPGEDSTRKKLETKQTDNNQKLQIEKLSQKCYLLRVHSWINCQMLKCVVVLYTYIVNIILQYNPLISWSFYLKGPHWGWVTHVCVSKLTSWVQIMACRLFSSKPLSKPMLSYCQLDPNKHISVKTIS